MRRTATILAPVIVAACQPTEGQKAWCKMPTSESSGLGGGTGTVELRRGEEAQHERLIAEPAAHTPQPCRGS